MKLLLCLKCGDIFNLTMAEKQCSCKQTLGKYINRIDVKITGNCKVIGFANTSFIEAIQIQEIEDKAQKCMI